VSTPEQKQAEAQMRAERLCLAYARVFGQDDANRSEDQRLVMADFEHRGYINRSTMVPDTSAEGQRIFVLNTKELIRRAKVTAKKPKPVVRKQP
jgi:hypothetical protein